MKVRDLAIREVYFAGPDTPIKEVAAMMKRHGVGAIPVCQGDCLIGMVTDRDLVVSCLSAGIDPCSGMAKHCMTSSVITVGPDTEVEEAARIMGKEQVHRLPVMENDRLVGIISLGDIAVSITDNSLVAETLKRISLPAQVACVTRDR